MSDFRPIGLLACPAKLWEQLVRPRLDKFLRPLFSDAQAGGSIGHDLAALRLLDVLSMRRSGSAPDARNGSAGMWLAFLDLRSCFCC